MVAWSLMKWGNEGAPTLYCPTSNWCYSHTLVVCVLDRTAIRHHQLQLGNGIQRCPLHHHGTGVGWGQYSLKIESWGSSLWHPVKIMCSLKCFYELGPISHYMANFTISPHGLPKTFVTIITTWAYKIKLIARNSITAERMNLWY